MKMASRLSSSWVFRSLSDPQCGHLISISLHGVQAVTAVARVSDLVRFPNPALAVDRQPIDEPSKI